MASFDVAGNWRDLATGLTATTPPMPGDNLVFSGTISNANLTNLHGFNLAEGVPDFAGIQFVNGYGGTVTIAPDATPGISTALYLQSSGAVSQPVANTDLTVLSNFAWTGGTLNSSAHRANVTITGGTALIAPANEGTVNLGDSINLNTGAVATMLAGTINVTNDGTELNVNAGAEMRVAAGLAKTANVNVTNTWDDPQLNVKSGAWFKVLSGNYVQQGSANVTGGSFVLEDGTSAKFRGVVKGILVFPWAFNLSSGATYIAVDATLFVGDHSDDTGGGMYAGGGLLSIKCGTKAQTVFNLVGDLEAAGATVAFDADTGSRRNWGEFKVQGNVVWLAGTYEPFVDAEGASGDLWSVTGIFTIEGTASVAPSAIDYEGSVVTPESDMEWQLFESATDITAANNTPSLPNGWSFVKEMANPANWWHLKKN